MNPNLLSNFAEMTVAEVDALPFGAICISLDGMILSYNQYEARLSHLDAHRVIGKNFFRDIAPCTDVQAFAGRMREFVATGTDKSAAFPFTFAFVHGSVEVSIAFVLLPGAESVLIAVERIAPAGATAT